jgi:hypothetical protein
MPGPPAKAGVEALATSSKTAKRILMIVCLISFCSPFAK